MSGAVATKLASISGSTEATARPKRSMTCDRFWGSILHGPDGTFVFAIY
jgi:hypothetical protein